MKKTWNEDELKTFSEYVAIIRKDDAEENKEKVAQLAAAGIRIEILDKDYVVTMFASIGVSDTDENIWPKGTIYLVPKDGHLFTSGRTLEARYPSLPKSQEQGSNISSYLH